MTSYVSRTLSEICQTSLKAARGTGCPWGLAEDTGHAVRLLEAHGLPGVDTLARLMSEPRACMCYAQGSNTLPACGITAAAHLSDTLATIGPDGWHIGPVAGALLLLAPLLHSAQYAGVGYKAQWPGGTAIISSNGLTLTGTLPSPVLDSFAVVQTDQTTTEPTHPADWRSRDVPAPAWQQLDLALARTLVPETEQSRAAGAGPGSADDD